MKPAFHLVAAATLAMTVASSGAPLATESFDYPVGTLLNTTTAASGWSTGWKSDRALTGVLANSIDVTAGDLAMPNYPATGGNKVSETSDIIMFRGLNDSVDFSRNMTRYVGFMVDWTGNSSGSFNAMRMGLARSDNDNTFFALQGDNVNANKFMLNMRLNGVNASPPGTLYDPGTYLLVVQINAVSSGLDSMNLKLFSASDPIVEPVTWDVTVSSGLNIVFNALSVRGVASGARAFDNIKYGKTFADVIPKAPEVIPQPFITYRHGLPPQVDLEWRDPDSKWALQTSRDLSRWAHIHPAGYQNPQQGDFKFTENAGSSGFYRLHKLGADRAYVVGDSISTPGTWPSMLANSTGKHVFSQAIGGSTSPSMVNRARGVELAFPTGNPTTPGTIRMKWHRHIADRTDNPTYRSQWAYYAKAVSEPSAIEVYQNGSLLGFASKILKNFTTNHAANPKTIQCQGHGLASGDRVTFIGNDPAFPDDLSVSSPSTDWNFSSTLLPAAIIERRVYFAVNVTADTFEIKERMADAASIDIGGNATGTPSIECGWAFDVNHTGGAWNVTWAPRTKYDDSIWLLEVSANDIPIHNVNTVTIPNFNLLLAQMTEIQPRFIVVCPPSGSFPDRGPGTFNWTNYYDNYMPWVRAAHPANHIDTMALFDANRTAKEKGFLTNPTIPERLWISGSPTTESSWQASKTATAGWHETWVGPGYIPLQYRSSFDDNIHPNNAGYQVISNAVAAMIAAKGW